MHTMLPAPKPILHGSDGSKTLLFEDPASRQVREQIDRLGPSSADILIIGDTGTGKELVARELHRLSPRARGPFTPVNCAALSEALFESELFGHERGAFTGAVGARAGWFESANGGTIFLDEVGDLALSMQVKLLRVLQEREVVRVGSRHPIKLNVRVIAATNVRLEKAVSAGHFREDLYYRLRVASLSLPSLRERPRDILPLARMFITVLCDKLDRRLPELSAAAEQVLMAHHWPGNIRELENVIHNALIVCHKDVVRAEDLQLAAMPPPLAHAEWHNSSDDASLAQLEHALLPLFERNLPNLYDYIDEAVMRSSYKFCHRNQVQTSKLLGLSRNIVRAKLIRAGEIAATGRAALGAVGDSMVEPVRPTSVGRVAAPLVRSQGEMSSAQVGAAVPTTGSAPAGSTVAGSPPEQRQPDPFSRAGLTLGGQPVTEVSPLSLPATAEWSWRRGSS